MTGAGRVRGEAMTERGLRPTALTIVMVLGGVLLLLPGLCALYFAGSLFMSDGWACSATSERPLSWLSSCGFGLVCFLASLLGVVLLRSAWR